MNLSVIILLTIPVIYIFILRPRLKEYRYTAGILDAIDGRGGTFLQRLRLHLSGLKTIILASSAAAVAILPQVLDALHGFTGWSAFFSQADANKIAAALSLLSTLTHVLGLQSAARAEPKK